MRRNSWPNQPQHPDVSCVACGDTVAEATTNSGYCAQCFETENIAPELELDV